MFYRIRSKNMAHPLAGYIDDHISRALQCTDMHGAVSTGKNRPYGLTCWKELGLACFNGTKHSQVAEGPCVVWTAKWKHWIGQQDLSYSGMISIAQVAGKEHLSGSTLWSIKPTKHHWSSTIFCYRVAMSDKRCKFSFSVSSIMLLTSIAVS